jgi:hypothetical protein
MKSSVRSELLCEGWRRVRTRCLRSMCEGRRYRSSMCDRRKCLSSTYCTVYVKAGGFRAPCVKRVVSELYVRRQEVSQLYVCREEVPEFHV